MSTTDLTALTHLLTGEYGIVPASLVAGPRGFVGETYIVAAQDGRRFFAKLVPPAFARDTMPGNLAVLKELHALGIHTLSRPIRTLGGSLTTTLPGRQVLLLDFIEGVPGDTVHYAFEPFVHLLARIHQATPQIHTSVPREDFTLPWAAQFEQLFAQALRDPGSTRPQADLRSLLDPYQAQISRDWAALQTLAQACQGRAWAWVLTHGDAFGDNLITGTDGRLYLIDWDELLLAPVERDAWFHLSDEQATAAFLRIYRQTFPRYHPDPLGQRFYIYRRFFEDLTGYLAEIIEHPALAHQQKNLADLHTTCFQWLWPLLRVVSCEL